MNVNKFNILQIYSIGCTSLNLLLYGHYRLFSTLAIYQFNVMNFYFLLFEKLVIQIVNKLLFPEGKDKTPFIVNYNYI